MQGILWKMLADAEDTGGRWSMMEQEMPKSAGPPHKHLWSDETFYILTFLLENEVKTAIKGAFVNDRAQHAARLPRRQRHGPYP